MTNLLQPLTPELSSFARGDLSKRPNLWNGLVGCWKPSLGVSGMTLRDVSGHGNHGILTNMTLDDWVISGDPKSLGYALDFDGVDDNIEISPDNGSGFFHDPFAYRTISIWFTINSGVTGPSTLYNEGGINNGIGIGYRTAPDTIVYVLAQGGSSVEIASISTYAEDSALHNVVVVYNAGLMELHMGGLFESSGSNGSSVGSRANETLICDSALANPVITGGLPWKGKMISTSIWNRILLPSEIWDTSQHPNAMFEFADRFAFRTPTVGATGNISLPALTVLSSALSHGVSSLNLPVLTVLGTGTTGVTSASLTLPIITINALAKNHADANLLLPALSLSATDVAPATSSITLPVLAVLSSAISLHGDASLTLPVLTVLSSAISLHGDTSLTLPVLTVISTSSIASNGDVAVTFPVLIVSASSGLGGDIDLPALRLAIRAYNGSPPECVVMNTKSSAITEYKDYAFNSYARFNGVDLAANQNGIYALDISSLDESTYKIKAHIKTGQVDLYKESIQRLRNAYLTHETDGDVRITSVGDKAATRTYYLALQNSLNGVRERRIKFERGIRNRHFDFKIENIDGSELEIDGLRVLTEPIISKRR